MDKNLKNFLKNLKFNDGEIKNLVFICPMLEELDCELAASNVSAVTSFGYPIDEITFLVSTNPAFLCRNTNDLISDLNGILKDYGDIELALKNEPNLI